MEYDSPFGPCRPPTCRQSISVIVEECWFVERRPSGLCRPRSVNRISAICWAVRGNRTENDSPLGPCRPPTCRQNVSVTVSTDCFCDFVERFGSKRVRLSLGSVPTVSTECFCDCDACRFATIGMKLCGKKRNRESWAEKRNRDGGKLGKTLLEWQELTSA